MTTRGSRRGLVALCFAAVMMATTTVVAYPDLGQNANGQCYSCHQSIRQRRMELLDYAGTVNPRERNGVPDQGPLKYFTTAPGGNVGMTIHAINGQSKYAFQIIGFDDLDVTGGGELVYTDDPAWLAYRGNFPTYFALADGGRDGFDWGSGDPVTVTYDIHVDASTPPGYYLLKAALAGQPYDWYQEELFYLEVRDGNNDPTLTVNATCPGGGPIEVSWTNATPDRTIALVYARGLGNVAIPNGRPCAGTRLGLSGSGIISVFQGPSGANGSRTVNSNAVPGACGGYLQLLDVATCRTSNVAPIQ